MAQNDIWRAQTVTKVGETATSNILYFQENQTVPDDDLQQLVNDVGLAIGTAWIQACASDTFFLGIIASRISGITTPAFSFQTSLIGLVDGQAASPHMATVIRHYGRPAGPRRQGRIFFAGMLETDNLNGRLTNVGLQRLAPVVELLKNQAIASGDNSVRIAGYSGKDETAYEITKVQVRPNMTAVGSRQKEFAM